MALWTYRATNASCDRCGGRHGIDIVLLVVAADDGIMPQTREHLAIIDLLGIPRGVVAITKSDLAEPSGSNSWPKRFAR